MSIILHIVSAVTPYNRGGLRFATIAGRRLAAIDVPLAEVSDVHLEQLLADPNIDVVALPADGAVPVEAIAAVERAKRLRAAAAEYGDRQTSYHHGQAVLDERAAALSAREAALGEREEAYRLGIADTLYVATGLDTRTVTASEGLPGVGRPELAAAVGRNRDEPVDHLGAANTPERHLANEIAAGIVEPVAVTGDHEEVAAEPVVSAPTSQKRHGRRFTKTVE